MNIKESKNYIYEAVCYIAQLEGSDTSTIYAKYPLYYLKELGLNLINDKLAVAIKKAKSSINKQVHGAMKSKYLNETIDILAKVDNVSKEKIIEKYNLKELANKRSDII